MTLPAAFLETPIAHRALHDAARGVPENSLGAVRRAVTAGYGIEIDARLSADGVAVVFHDATLDRLTAETGPVRARTAAELSGIRLGGSDEAIPTLAAVLEEVAGAVPLVVELKDPTGRLAPGPARLAQAVAADLARYAGPVAAMSFNPHMMAALRDRAEAIPRGLVTCAFDARHWPRLPPGDAKSLSRIAAFDLVGASFISHAWADLNRPSVARLKARGVPVLCWTVTTPEIEARARAVADNITFAEYLPPRR